jgi:hypothetical protein
MNKTIPFIATDDTNKYRVIKAVSKFDAFHQAIKLGLNKSVIIIAKT